MPRGSRWVLDPSPWEGDYAGAAEVQSRDPGGACGELVVVGVLVGAWRCFDDGEEDTETGGEVVVGDVGAGGEGEGEDDDAAAVALLGVAEIGGIVPAAVADPRHKERCKEEDSG